MNNFAARPRRPNPTPYDWLHVRHANGCTVDWLPWQERIVAELVTRKENALLFGVTPAGFSYPLELRGVPS